MFQEWLLVAVKLLVVACVVALVVALLLMRAACARLVAQSGADSLARGFEQRPAREGSPRLQAGVRNVDPESC